MFISFEEKFTIEVQLSFEIHRYLKMRYFGFVKKNFNGNATHYISFGEKLTDKPYEIIRPPVAKGNKTFLYDTEGNTLYSNFLELQRTKTEIHISPSFNIAFLCNFIEYLYYLYLKNYEKTIIHCSAFRLNNTNVICPAGRNTGKTNILLESLANGAMYLADDWLICGPNGEIEIFPKAINMQSYNIPNARKLKGLDSIFRVYEWLDTLVKSTNFFSEDVHKAIIEKSQLFIPYQQLPEMIDNGVDNTLYKQKFVWLSKEESSSKPYSRQRVKKSSVINHILATRKIEHYPFELWNLIAIGLDASNKIINDDVDYNALKNLLRKQECCYQLTVPSQKESSLGFKALMQIVEE
jgi:hypothetical protein